MKDSTRRRGLLPCILNFPTICSLLCVFLFFTPWLFEMNIDTGLLWCLGLIWFFIAMWIFVVLMISDIIKAIKKNAYNNNNLISIIIMVACSVVCFVALANGFFIVE